MPDRDTQEFLTSEFAKGHLGIEVSTYDNQIQQFVQAANRKVSLAILPYYDLESLADTEFWDDCVNVALAYFQHLWHKNNRQGEVADSYFVEYKDSIKDIVKAVRTRRGTNAKKTLTTVSSNNVKNIRIHPPSQRDAFLLE